MEGRVKPRLPFCVGKTLLMMDSSSGDKRVTVMKVRKHGQSFQVHCEEMGTKYLCNGKFLMTPDTSLDPVSSPPLAW